MSPNGQSFADRYQSVLVPVIFEPWAAELTARAGLEPGQAVLDLGCGTGVVTRHIARTGPPGLRLTAADHSAEMLGVARSLSDDPAIDWVLADAGALPFVADSFDRVLCQQAFQFFPDRPAALTEVRRVLHPGGRVAFAVQRELAVNPMLRAQSIALDTAVGPAAGDAVRAICALSDPAELRDLFTGAGFEDVSVTPVTLTLHHPDASAFALGAMGGMHTGDKLSGMEGDTIHTAIKVFLRELGPCFDGAGMTFPHASHVILARR